MSMPEEQNNEIRNELKKYVNVLNKKPNEILEKTCIVLNSSALIVGWVGEDEVDKIKVWWANPLTQQSIHSWITKGKHKVNGKFGNWNAGCLGSRWADCEINGRICRFAFYSRKHNPTFFPPQMEEEYALQIDPTE